MGRRSFPETLWDLITGRPAGAAAARAPSRERHGKTRDADDRYARLVRAMKRTHGVRVRKWRSTTTGCAWQVTYADGTVARLIEAPYPRGPVSAAVFLHEVGHHAIGFNRYKPRCLEEYMAWRWALAAMCEHGVTVTPRVLKRVEDHLRYQIAKAMRRGLKQVPEPLVEYLATSDHPSALGRPTACPSSSRLEPPQSQRAGVTGAHVNRNPARLTRRPD